MKKVKIEIEGMSCSSCEGHVKGELEKLGAKKIVVSAKNKLATFNVDSKVDSKLINEAVKEAGYTPGEIIFTDIKKGFFGRLFG